MGNIRIKISGHPADTKTARMHQAVAAHWRLAVEEKERAARPKPKAVKRRTFAHIRDYRNLIT